jgi:carbonic anhydrase
MKSNTIILVAFACCVVAVGCAQQPPADTTAAEPAPEPVRDVVTAEQQRAMSPADVLADLKAGNERFVAGELTPRDYNAQAAATASGQYPKAIILSCVDSRVPVELVFDQGIGDVFVGRVAGNAENVDMLGSMEFATKAAGSKVIVVLGHTSCGAIKGAADGVELGNLTALLDNFDGALEKAAEVTDGNTTSKNAAFVSAAIEENVRQTMTDILERSEVISEMVDDGEVMVVGGIYDLASGKVTWLDA